MFEQVDVLDKGFVRLIEHLGDDTSVVQAARVSYGKGTKTVSEDIALVRYLMRHAHTTPFEMVTLKFHLKMPIFVARQWHRHRTASINEESARYSEMSDQFFVPATDTITLQDTKNKQGGDDHLVPDAYNMHLGFQWEQEALYEGYQNRLKSGMRKELARVNMPVSSYTQFYWQMNLHNLFHFLKLRLDTHAQYEIRVYAEAIMQIIKPIVPGCVEAFEDYVLKAVTLSAMDIKAIRSGHMRSDSAVNPVFASKREFDEFMDKINKIGLMQ